MRVVLVPFGTRPEIVKLAPVVAALRAAGVPVTTIATGQHYDPALAGDVLDAAGLRPDEHWQLGAPAVERPGEICSRAAAALERRRPDAVVVLGDTSTVPAFALAARAQGTPVVHLEAGLRSFNETSVEEVNRRVGAACASLHLAPTEMAAAFLATEGVPAERVRVVGNPVIDVLAASGVSRVPPEQRHGVVVTAHRATNVDDPERLARIVEIVRRLAAEVGPVTFPIHPRTRDRLAAAGLRERLEAPGVRCVPPLGYEQMLRALAQAAVVVTDSGGLQEEASWFGVPVVVLRRSTPRWEGVASGAAVLAGLDVQVALTAAVELATPARQHAVAALACPYGDGRTGARVARLLTDEATWELLRLREPDYVGRPPPSPASGCASVSVPVPR